MLWQISFFGFTLGQKKANFFAIKRFIFVNMLIIIHYEIFLILGLKMKKLSADTLMKFNTDIISVLSPDRLESYEGNIEQYYENRLLALQAGHKIAELEIFLRNKLDFCLKNLVGEDWIKTPKSLEIIKLKDLTSIKELTPSQMLSLGKSTQNSNYKRQGSSTPCNNLSQRSNQKKSNNYRNNA